MPRGPLFPQAQRCPFPSSSLEWRQPGAGKGRGHLPASPPTHPGHPRLLWVFCPTGCGMKGWGAQGMDRTASARTALPSTQPDP